MTLSIIIPVFNEEATIKQLLEKVNGVKLSGIKKEIIVVDDCSSDSTNHILIKLTKIKFKYLRHNKNLGKGAAVRTAVEHATGDLIIIQDADLEYDPLYYIDLLGPLKSDKVKVVYGSRLINYPLRFWGENRTVLPLHLIANKFLTFLTNLLFGSNLTDMETGYKLFRKDILKKIVIDSERFDFEAEITAKILRRKIPIIEVPISVKPRSYKEGKKIGWRDGLVAIWTLIKYRFI